MNIVRAHHAGACYGVERALSMVNHALQEYGAPVYTLGPLIHNPTVVKELESWGIVAIESLDNIKSGTLVIRSHGVAPDVIEQARAQGLNIVDATCPHVSKVHKASSRLSDKGYFVIVVGEAGHPEVEGICGYAGSQFLVVPDAESLPEELPSAHIGVVVQTTQSEETFEKVAAVLKDRIDDLEIHNTVCFATQLRQEAARDVAKTVDAMIIVGGRNSGNTRRLYQISSKVCPRTYHIESPEEINVEWFEKCETVGVTAGASTPESQIIAVIDRLKELS
jgi:4-hydroxy-3-methylbut-2-en-1-yl diphosphate reductase